MRVLLVQPREDGASIRYQERTVVRFARRLMNRVFGLSLGSGNRVPPLGLMMLGALTPPDVDVRIVDEYIEPVDPDMECDLVGISLLTMTAQRGYELADEFRARGVPVVLGGIHATVLPEEAMQHADAVVVGEAEGLWEQVLHDSRNGGLRSRYQRDGRPDLAGLPVPRRDLVDADAYVMTNLVQVGRGCPNRCAFCAVHLMAGTGYRSRPVDEVVDELEGLTGRMVLFVDDNLISSPEYAKELFRRMIPLRLRWLAQASLAICEDAELLELAEQSGCRLLLVGFESLSKENIRAIGKAGTNRVEDYEAAIAKLHAHGIGVVGQFIVGLDGDDESVFEETASFVNRAGIEAPTIGFLTPYPGTRVFTELQEQGRLLHTDWRYYSHTIGRPAFEPLNMTPEALEMGCRGAMQEIYSPTAITRRLAGAPAAKIPLLAWNLRRRKSAREASAGHGQPIAEATVLRGVVDAVRETGQG